MMLIASICHLIAFSSSCCCLLSSFCCQCLGQGVKDLGAGVGCFAHRSTRCDSDESCSRHNAMIIHWMRATDEELNESEEISPNLRDLFNIWRDLSTASQQWAYCHTYWLGSSWRRQSDGVGEHSAADNKWCKYGDRGGCLELFRHSQPADRSDRRVVGGCLSS